MQARDSWGNDASPTPFARIHESYILKPGLVPGNFSVYIKICAIILIFVRESVRNVSESISVGRS
jgi:hypothetical protein